MSPRWNPDAALLKLYTVLLPTTHRSQRSLLLLFSLGISCSVWVDHAYISPPPQTIFVDSILERNLLCSVRAKAFVTCFLDLGSNTAGELTTSNAVYPISESLTGGGEENEEFHFLNLGKLDLNLKMILPKSWFGTQNTQIKQNC